MLGRARHKSTAARAHWLRNAPGRAPLRCVGVPAARGEGAAGDDAAAVAGTTARQPLRLLRERPAPLLNIAGKPRP